MPQPLEVELGCGDGSFLLRAAQSWPDRNFFGVERLLGRIRKLDRQGRRLGLKNLRALRIEAAYCIQYLLPAASVRVLHVYFPDPWPKLKHQQRRLVQSSFTGLARRVLVPGGRVYLRTDDEVYFDQMRAAFAADPVYHEVTTPPALASLATDFEEQFRGRGRTIFGIGYQTDG